MFCGNCGKQVADIAVVCVSCGCPPAGAKNFCRNCGAKSNLQWQGAEFCTQCGASLAIAKPVPADAKSKIAAGLFGIFLGGFGIHRFYLGYVEIGIIQIVVTFLTCGMGAWWGFIEGILILTGNMNTDAEGRPLKD